MRRWAARHGPWINAGLVVALTLKVTTGLLAAIDLGLADETYCLAMGLRLAKDGMPSAEASPLYAVWYRLLAFMEPDPTRLYFLNWWILVTALPLALYALARRSGASLGSASVVAVAWMLSHCMGVWPYVTYFSTLVLALTAIGVTYIGDKLAGAAAIALAVAVDAFVRPELWIPTLVFAAPVAALLVRRAVRERRGPPLALAAVVALTPVALRAALGTPTSGGRGIFALAQHYALNRIDAGGLRLDPWNDWEPIFRGAFPHATTVGEAALENPSAFLWHIGHNAVVFPDRLLDMVSIDAYVPLVVKVAASWVLVAMVAVGVACGLSGRMRRRLPPTLVRWAPLGLPVAMAGAAAVLLVHPRTHYLVPLSFFALAALAACAGTVRLPAPAQALAPALLAVLLVALPTHSPRLPGILAARVDAPLRQENLRTVETLTRLGLHGHLVVLESEFSRALYASLDFDEILLYEKDAPFWSFVDARTIDVVVINQRLRDDTRFREDDELRAFLASPESHPEFVLVPVEGAAVMLAVRRSRLA
jgi:hypothetical protein